MYRYRSLVNIFLFMLIVMAAFGDNYNPFKINDVRMFSQTVNDAVKTADPLYEEIKEKSREYYEPPQNAVIDEVWKKMPGLNGVKVNVDKSYKQMKKQGKFNESLLVFDQITPEVSLNDLPAAPIYRGHPDKRMVTLLINVSWGSEYIPPILKTLKDHKIKAAFFIEGKWAKENPDYVEMIHEQGHIIGNHAYNHPDMARLSQQQAAEQIQQTNDVIAAIIDKKPEWFAPPSGSFNGGTVKAAHQMNMQTVLWTVDTIDWKNPTVSVMMNRVMNNIHPGATILMHPTASIAQGLGPLIKEIKENNYRIGTISTLLSEER
ncbi:polysaccharide deacetylase family protein [Virgibacillus kekensis]|uniref:Polysaccharide deacetylase family protein n=1 Tax=Virgibacillus kekensis TaxID=202261 RepID=A0ABV9DEC7_9BACI